MGWMSERRWRRWLSSGAVAVTVAGVTAVTAQPALAAEHEWLDLTYGTGGVGGTADEYVAVGMVDGEGRALTSSFDFENDFIQVRRLTEAGASDPTFAGGSLPFPMSGGITLNADAAGTLTVSRVIHHDGGASTAVMSRYTSAGVLDPTFGSGGTVTVLEGVDFDHLVWVSGIIERESGYILSAIRTDYVPDYVETRYLIALTSAGVLDPTWAPGADTPGILPVSGSFFGMAADGDAVVVAGVVYDDGVPEVHNDIEGLARFTSAGALDNAFGDGGYLALGDFYPEGGVQVVGGSYYAYGTYWGDPMEIVPFVLKLNDEGVPDPTFGTGGHALGVAGGECHGASGLFFAGDYLYLNNYTCGGGTGLIVDRFSAGGVLDTSYGDGGRVLIDTIMGQPIQFGRVIGVQPSGQLLATYNVQGVTTTSGVVRLLSELVPDVTEPGAFDSVEPQRILDTRVGNGAPVGKVPAGGELELQVAGRGGVPADGAVAVVLNVTVTEPGTAGYVTAFPTGTEAPLASNLNFTPGQTIPNLVTVKLGTDGKVSLKNGSGGGVHLIADVAGYYLDGEPTEAGAFVSLEPQRLLDTRFGNGAPTGKVGSLASIDLEVAGRGGVPAEGAGAVILNVTVTEPGAVGYITVYPSGVEAPLASNLNFSAGQTIPNLVMVKLGTGGYTSLKNGSLSGSHLIADVAGYFLS